MKIVCLHYQPIITQLHNSQMSQFLPTFKSTFFISLLAVKKLFNDCILILSMKKLWIAMMLRYEYSVGIMSRNISRCFRASPTPMDNFTSVGVRIFIIRSHLSNFLSVLLLRSFEILFLASLLLMLFMI